MNTRWIWHRSEWCAGYFSSTNKLGAIIALCVPVLNCPYVYGTVIPEVTEFGTRENRINYGLHKHPHPTRHTVRITSANITVSANYMSKWRVTYYLYCRTGVWQAGLIDAMNYYISGTRMVYLCIRNGSVELGVAPHNSGPSSERAKMEHTSTRDIIPYHKRNGQICLRKIKRMNI